MDDFRWDVICVTARHPAHAEAYRNELQRRRGSCSVASLIIAVGDPNEAECPSDCANQERTSRKIGSGGATLNALLLVAEHLSAQAGESNVDMAALQGRRVLVLHVGGADQRLPAFSLLPAQRRAGGRLLSTVDLLLEGLAKLARRCPAGLFVVSSEDAFVRVGDDFCERFGRAASRRSASAGGSGGASCCGAATALAAAAPQEVAEQHGVYDLRHAAGAGESSEAAQPLVRRLHYRAGPAELEKIKLVDNETSTDAQCSRRFAKVCGVVFFNTSAAEKLLQLAFLPVFESCSYLGIDSGALPKGFSLYLDLLACLGEDVTIEEFVHPTCIEGQVRVDEEMRRRLWTQLHGQIDLCAVLAEVDDPAQVVSVRSAQDYARLVASLKTSAASPSIVAPKIAPESLIGTQVFIEPTLNAVNGASGDSVDEAACVVNSVLKASRVGPGAVVESSIMDRCTVGPGAVCSGLKRVVDLEVPAGLSLQQVSLFDPRGGPGTSCLVTFLLQDEATRHSPEGTFLGEPFSELERRTGITADDLWGSSTVDAALPARTLKTARLFPAVSAEIRPHSLALAWVEYVAALRAPGADGEALLQQWRGRWVQTWRAASRLSLAEVMERVDVAAEFAWQDAVAAETNVLRAKDLLLHHADATLRYIIDDEINRGSWRLLDVLDEVAADPNTPTDVRARTMFQVAEVLAGYAGVAGGLRSGSARNPRWRDALAGLASPDGDVRRDSVLEMRRLRTLWLKDGPVALIRAARHYEAAAQVLIQGATATASAFIKIAPAPAQLGAPMEVVVEAPARFDLAGGWTDTPPICYERGGAVTNIALRVDGCRPIGARAERLPGQLELVLETRSELPAGAGGARISGLSEGSSTTTVCRELGDLEDFDSPQAPAVLLKASLLCCGIVTLAAGSPPLRAQLSSALGGGLRVVSWSRLPQGSGMGTSSILAAVVIKAILVAVGRDIDDSSLVHAVLKVEQMMTTGGGWQDQVGGVYGGAKIARSAAALPLRVATEPLPLEEKFAADFASRLVLVFTGRPRLAKYLLQNVIRQWFGRMPVICDTVHGLVANAEAAATAFREQNLAKLGECVNTYWAQKQVMAPGCEPRAITLLREKLAPGLLGMSLAGAGGGGFAVLITKEPHAQEWVQAELQSVPGFEDMSLHSAEVDYDGLTVLTNGAVQSKSGYPA
eukprot:TRINITY_DN1162_c0_g1_i1.p1 TRINITY_DN1162_c0_g1~~TRINITY_DN1162_c0_g1_i1.p1  ORF type:complete len:1182 (+),score=285.74 TRINITY_DN1162_c0_g1_i1:147-3692(+)